MRHLRDFLPGGVAGRIALILLLALLAVQAVSIALYMGDRADATLRVFAHSVGDRIIAATRLIEDTPDAAREAVLRAVNSPTLLVSTSDTPPERRGAPAKFERRVREHLAPLAPRAIQVDFAGWHERDDRSREGNRDDDDPPDQREDDDWRHHGRPADAFDQVGPTPDLLPSRDKMSISVQMTDGRWLRFLVAAESTSLRWAVRQLFWVALSAAVVILFAWWIARRVTRPVRRFAAAAERLGMDMEAEPLPEHGSRELREATRAFNTMQERIRRFVTDRTQMIAAISHDLRTALTRLQLRTEFIEDGEQRAKALADIEDMKTMLAATLSFARDDAAREATAEIDLAATVQSLASDAADSGGAVRYAGPDRLPFTGRPVALRRAIANLVDNALRYGGEADLRLEEDGRQVRLTVADRGPGIPADQREAVFGPFFRLEGSRSRETGGTGLGLAVARSIARAHGGDIALGDREGGGLAVEMVLPRAARDQH